MKESPRRPLILKRRKLPLRKKETNVLLGDPNRGPCAKTPPDSGGHRVTESVRIIDHPSVPDTPLVIIPKSADLQSVIDALTAKGKECGPEGPNKFILLGSSLENGAESLCLSSFGGGSSCGKTVTVGRVAAEGDGLKDRTRGPMEVEPVSAVKPSKRDSDCSLLDDSLTNIQWLGRMNTDGLGPASARKDCNKENEDLAPQLVQPLGDSEEAHCAVKDPLSERPPYSYMAMIQFAINSKKNRRMTLKEIYTWIENHFPYFRNVAKPGWKNSIRHNLSLHDMFLRESSSDGKTSYWTIRPESNRCLTLDQVYKNQKQAAPEVKKPVSCGFERKMKRLLPRTDSYLVPIQLPLNPSLFLSSTNLSPAAAAPQQNCSPLTPSAVGGGKRVRIAPKVPQSALPAMDACKEDSAHVPPTGEGARGLPAQPRREASSSRRKQRLVRPSSEEPVLLFPESPFFDSGVASDLSTFHDAEADPEPRLDPRTPGQEYDFKTPIKGRPPASSTPSKPPGALPELGKVTPQGPGVHSLPDFSPIRTPCGTMLTPQRQDHTPFSFSSTPFKELPLFSSPRELLTIARTSPLTRSCSRKLQVGSAAPANRSLTEGLVLDTMSDSLSKILVDISFPGLEDEELGMGNISWSQLIPELK
ncbi:hypothetical protein Z043_121213 [Scleropages formosus]|uniref:Forkhead box protein M1 n=1 Tax=Scleropages formosus TaxID=113540 RepID=A0A0P7TIJ7_SCLFO|nr:hypothetical protein Z043_121213 [Scleropages formosus]